MWEQTLKKIDHLTTPNHMCELWGGDSSTLKIINNQINCVYYFKRNQIGYYKPKVYAPTGCSDPVKTNDNLVLWFTKMVKINKEEGI